jgi:hypothetical protein
MATNVLDKMGTLLHYNDRVTFEHPDHGYITGKVIAFTENGDIFVDKPVLRGKTWAHETYKVAGTQSVLLPKTNEKPGS